MSESTIQQGIVCYLSSIAHQYNFLFFSVPNEGLIKLAKMLHIPDKITYALMAILKKMGLTSGVSDLIIGHKGKMYCPEVKTETGKQSPNQILFEAWCKSCGIEYRVVRNVEEMARALVEWGVIK